MKEKNTESLSKKLKKEFGYTTEEGREVQEFIYEYKCEDETDEQKGVPSTGDEGR